MSWNVQHLLKIAQENAAQKNDGKLRESHSKHHHLEKGSGKNKQNVYL